ncbi:trypsin-like serine peptidase [Streptomyces spongiae]|uniref:Trypsin-like peptidase domain-containing protein n=1 Tax=Streptomyces spongiae TaxID=565072 RepID=A0A5N8XFJ3_9ACTN|nr:serine protease [Streptomyces spongiae]MPY57994.1 trypsin-like peptidase domain-containing protein [Streptomyces spongiae]
MAADGGVDAGSSLETPCWAVRIRRANGEIAGAGILLSPDRVLTCAHVVEDRAARFAAEFVGAAPGFAVPSTAAWVDGDAYVPNTRDADGDPSGDVALLRLEHPRPAGETTLLHRLSPPNRTVQMYGFPYDHNGGIWFRASIVGGCGRDGQVQLSPTSPGELASPGCSGSGVVDALTGKVIGMVLSGIRDQHGNVFSFMSPAETIVRHLPEVDPWTLGRTAVDDRLRSTREDAAEALLDEPFAQRLADWLQDDGQQVKISLVPVGDGVRAATLRRAITLADRELRTAASVDRASLDPPGTVPSAGGHDLAVDAAGLTSAEIGERIAERMGLWQHPADPVAERIRAADVTLTLVVVGVDEATDPPALLNLLKTLRAKGNRLLLVFRTADAIYHRARYELVAEPERERRARLIERLEEITGPLAQALHRHMAAVRAEGVRPADTDLMRAHAALAALRLAQSAAGGSGPRPDLARYERLAERVAARMNRAIAKLDDLRDRRDELDGRLRGYHVLHLNSVRGQEEDLTVDALRHRAHELLRARPCDVKAAEAAVDAYTRRVDRGGPPRQGQGGASAS